MRGLLMLACTFLCILLHAQISLHYPNIDTVKLKVQQQFYNDSRSHSPLRIKEVYFNGPAAVKVSVIPYKQAHAKKSPVKQLPALKDAYSCYDSSFTKLIGLRNEWMYVNNIAYTSDDGILISGNMFDTTAKNPFWQSDGYIVKTDNDGNIAWVKKFADAEPHKEYFLSVFRAFELGNKDIIAIASMDTTSGTYNDVTVVLRLDKNGNILWHTPLKNKLSKYTSGLSIDIKTLAEGLNGDLIFCGTSLNNSSEDGDYETIIRMDANGKLIWDANYGNGGDYHGGADGIGAFVIDNKIVECGLSLGDNYNSYEVAINFLTLDYATGDLIKKKFIVPDYPTPQQRANKAISFETGKITRLDNGHYMVYGDLYALYPTPATDTSDYFGMVEFDEDFNLVSSHTVSSVSHPMLYPDFILTQPDGKIFYTLGNYFTDSSFNLFLVAEQNNQLLKSRQLHYTKTGNAGTNGFVTLNDNGYAYIQSHFDLSGSVKSYIEFKKLHNSDTASDCLGTDSVIALHLPYNFKADTVYNDLYPNEANNISVVNYKISVSDTLSHSVESGCVQKNNCDTISIHGKTNICGTDDAVIFTSYKNQNCGAFTQWNIDTSIIRSLQQINDTAVSVKFKNVTWNGNIYAVLPAPKCFTGIVADSLQLHLVQINANLSLGADTMLCGAGVSLLLHAGPGFATYQWQNGSADSIFHVTTAGKYFVTVTDYCGNQLSDTINIAKAEYAFNVGNDTSKCNNDTIVLKATPGFTNYVWQPGYNVYNSNDNQLKVFPQVDTFYSASAQKAGCTFFDTVYIKVLHSPDIFLGNDTSLCFGTSLQLYAGTGFKTYIWSTGEKTESIYAGTADSYSVQAIALNNCSSSDTLHIIAIKPLPVFSLGNDTSLCSNETLAYNFNLNNAMYNWSTGSHADTAILAAPGNYWLTVTQNLCSATDSIAIIQKPSPQVSLGADTTLCANTTKILEAAYPGAKYLWQDASTNSRYIVTKAGLYYVTLFSEGCTAGDSINISYHQPPYFNLGKDTSICNGSNITLKPVLNTPSGYYWQNGSNQPYYTVTQPGTYYLTATNSCGSYTDSLLVGTAICQLILPSAFTPNHDGLNDVFKIRYPPLVKTFSMIIYNRWGQQVFISRDITKGWDGNYAGYPVSQDTFVWTMLVVDIHDVKTTLHGTVTVIR